MTNILTPDNKIITPQNGLLTPDAIKQANDFAPLAGYVHTWESKQFLKIKQKTIALFFGNQRGKGAMTIMGYIHRIMGSHPIAERNINYFKCYNGHTFSPSEWLDGFEPRYKDGLCPKCAKPNRKEVRLNQRGNKIIRFAGDILPESEKDEVGKGTKEVKSPEEKLILFANEKEGDNFRGVSLLRPAYKSWYFKEAFEKIDAISFERQGVGIPVFKMPTNATPDDREKAEEIGKNLRANE
ncbi:hypothetical protein LCGC14_1696760, partial [marine sediment metagenome]